MLNKRLPTFNPAWMAINEQENCYRLEFSDKYLFAFLVLEFIFRDLVRNLLAARDRREICRPFSRGEILRRESANAVRERNGGLPSLAQKIDDSTSCHWRWRTTPAL
jgi:hypothetical protein